MGPNSPFAGGPPARQPKTEAQMMWEAIRQIEENLNSVVGHVNKWVAKLQGIDSVAFAALMLHGGKEFSLTAESVAANQKQIQAILAEMARYSEDAKQKAEAAKAAETQPSVNLATESAPKTTELPKETEDKDEQPADPAKG